MEMILYIALGIVLGFFLLAFIDKVIVAVILGIGAVIGLFVLVIGFHFVNQLYSENPKGLGQFLLFLGFVALIWELLKLLNYAYSVHTSKKRLRKVLQTVGDVDGGDGDSVAQRETDGSPYAESRYLLQRETDIGWVTIDGHLWASELRGIRRRGLIARLFFEKRHRIRENQRWISDVDTLAKKIGEPFRKG
jgi:hypothetical protein